MRLKENPLARRVFLGRADVSSKETMAATHTAALVDTQQAQAANAEIVVALRRHDPEMMEQLIERYQHRLFRYLLFLVGNRDLAQDCFKRHGCACWNGVRNSAVALALKPGCLRSLETS